MMKLTLTREALLQPLQMVIGVVDRKQAMPILSNILLKTHVNEKQFSIIGSDLEIELTGHSSFSEALTIPWQLTLPGKKLLDICRALPEKAMIDLYPEKQQVMLRSQRSRFTLSTLPAEDYPSTEPQATHIEVKMNSLDLLHLLQRTHFAMAHQDVRYYLNGMLFEFLANSLRTVSTDGHRLATDAIDTHHQDEHRLQIIVPRKGIIELIRVLNSSEHEVTLSVTNSYIKLVADQYTFISKLIEGRFPDYQRVIPKSGDKKIMVNREEFRQALIRTAVLSNDKARGIFLELKPNILRLLANNSQQELAEEEISIDYSGIEFGLAFNVGYLLDALNILTSDQVELIFASTHNNSLLLTEPNSRKCQAFVIMPMRI